VQKLLPYEFTGESSLNAAASTCKRACYPLSRAVLIVFDRGILMMIRRPVVVFPIICLIFLPAFCVAQAASDSGPASPMITGTVTYRVRMALPPNAAIDVRLEDVSRADAPASVVAENIFLAAGKQVPIPFQLPYTAGDIQPNHRYQARAQIMAGDRLLFVTTTAYPVLTNGAPSTVNMVLQPVSSAPEAAASGTESNTDKAGSTPLFGTTWRLTDLDGRPPAQTTGKNFAQLVLDGSQNRYSGSSGCNRLTGTIELKDDSLNFGAGASTMMACPEPLMTQEQAFTKMLQSVTGYRIRGRTLELLAGDKTVAQFKAVKPAQPAQ
jgi:putative lipoprotein